MNAYQSDFLIIGSGVAGLLFALNTAHAGRVALVTKKEAMESNTNQAQGGIAAVLGGNDSFDLHIEDTLSSGAGLCHPEVVRLVVEEGPQRIAELVERGVSFNRPVNAAPGKFDLGREGGHSRNRIVHTQDMTGREVERALLAQVREHPNIDLFENHIAIDLITHSTRMKRGLVTTTHEEHCCGAYVLDRQTRQVVPFVSRIVLLATGGAGKVYLYTSNPDIATGDGLAMAYRAGATLANLEFVQFHPTCLYHPEAKNFLISEAVRGEGAILLDARGDRFMERYDPARELACRDVVARAIDTELKKSGDDAVFLDISGKDADFIRHRFPNLYENCLRFGIDMTREPIPVVPAAHYMCGGVVTDTEGRTDIRQLYAVGETACTGLHGANRLASNSLLECLVFGARIARTVSESPRSLPSALTDGISDERKEFSPGFSAGKGRMILKRTMERYLSLVRNAEGIRKVQDLIEDEYNRMDGGIFRRIEEFELYNMAMVSEQIAQSALARTQSVGGHFRSDYPPDNKE